MIRLLILVLLGFLVYTVIHALQNSLGRSAPPKPPASTNAGEDMVKDPHCGTYVPRSDAVEATIRGQRHYFCSKACRDAFRKQL